MGLVDGKVAMVTGGASGIGAATSKTLASEGASVVVSDLNAEGAESVARAINAAGGTAVGVRTDVSDPASVQAAVAFAVKTYGGLDVLHNNAAAFGADVIMQDFNVVDIDLAVWEKTLAVNLTGALLGCRFAVPEMLKRGGGSIINTASVAGWLAEDTRVAYSVSKAGLINLAKHVATAFGKQGVRCNAVAPGVVVTETSKGHMSEEWINGMKELHSTPRLIEPSDIADAVLFLASDLSRQVNGHVLTVDAALSAHLPKVEG
ncbi:MAG: oxidoreductase [Actinomycetia bacterium]|nr:oxidoreductase [Actinomycetes bacterium]